MKSKDVKLPASFRGKMPTSVDGMSPKSPFLLKLAELPVAPPIKANSIVAINGDDERPLRGERSAVRPAEIPATAGHDGNLIE